MVQQRRDVVGKSRHEQGDAFPIGHKVLIRGCELDHLVERRVDLINRDEQTRARFVELVDDIAHAIPPGRGIVNAIDLDTAERRNSETGDFEVVRWVDEMASSTFRPELDFLKHSRERGRLYGYPAVGFCPCREG